MRIAITLLFDLKAEEVIRNLWQNLELDLSFSQPQALIRYPPHITLSVYDVIEVDPYIEVVEKLLPHCKSFPLRLDVLGIFPEAKVLFLAPRMTKALMNIQQEITETINEQPVAAHLLPNQWQPHCTLARGLSNDHLIELVKRCQLHMKPVEAEVSGIGIQVIPETVNRWYGAFPQERSTA